MNIKSFMIMTGAVFLSNGSLDSLLNDNYSSARAAINPHVIDYMIHRDDPKYLPDIRLQTTVEPKKDGASYKKI